jgi:hypothetical protein
MRVVTFYSFKGGVGRTLALLNVAASLIARGNRVLIVDFDLEAPGFDRALGLSFVPSRGMVDLISDYLRDGQVPRVEDYVAEAQFRIPSSASSTSKKKPQGDRSQLAAKPLLVLPAGLRSDENDYKNKLQGIDFKKLYQERDGYVFFDDVRQQFGKALSRDYVLIDSRTGHSDMGKICTQQLPDHVIALMVPNEQNLAGIEQEVRDIRERHEMCAIDLVLSRVPRIDDLEGELRDFESRVQRSTRVRRVLRVHAAESLALLKDDIYCADFYFERAQLTEDYQRIVKAILVRNVDSREAVLYALEGGMARVAATVGRKHAAAWVEAVLSRHANDERVLEELKAALRGAEHVQQRSAVSSRLEFVSQLSPAALAAHKALEADQAGDAKRARKDAVDALSRRAELSFGLAAECFALLCRVSPDDADRIASDGRSPTVASMLMIESIAEYETQLLSTLGGVKAVHEAISSRMRFERKEEAEGQVEMLAGPRVRGSRSPHHIRVDRRIERPLRAASAALGVATEGFSVWMRRYVSASPKIAPPDWEDQLCLEHPEAEPLSREELASLREEFPFWRQYGLDEEKFKEDERLQVKGFVSIQHALFGELAPATQLLDEIDDLIRQRAAASSEPIWNGWRLLYTRLSDFRADLLDLIQAREAEGCKVGSPPPSDLKRLAPPLGERRGQESK